MAGASKPTRIDAHIAATAEAVARGENRSTAEQINHWARLGMQMERSASLDSRRIQSVVTGTDQFSSLTSDERAAAHASIDARMANRVAKERFGPAARHAGGTTVSIGDDGEFVLIDADGTTRSL